MIEEMEFSDGCDWVTSKDALWRSLLGHLRGQPAKGLEIGVYEGRSLQWWLLNILDHPDSSVVAIDPWTEKSADNINRIKSDPVQGPKLTFIGRPGQKAMAELLSQGHAGTFDFAYVDGGKEARHVLELSVLAWMLLKPGGVAIWDDYLWEWTPDSLSPRPETLPRAGIDAFLSANEASLEEIHRGWQVAARKTKH